MIEKLRSARPAGDATGGVRAVTAVRRALDAGRTRGVRRAAAVGVPLALAGAVTAAAPGVASLVIQRGDTLSEIAARHHTTVAELVALNHLPGNGDLIIAGKTLQLPGAVAPAAAPAAPPAPAAAPAAAPAPATQNVAYKVVPGDTLIGIGKHFGVDPKVIAAANHLPRSGLVMIGQTLQVPVPAPPPPAPAAPAGRTYPAAVTASANAHRAQLARTGVPSRAQMEALVRSTARTMHVDPSLALAVAYQESGFNMRVVSAADAIGVMQVLPSTAAWVGRDVVGRHLDPLKPEDNVVIGVALLRGLLTAAPVDQAVAGYYQGLGSVRANGMYADTQSYVANVLALQKRFR